MAAIDASMPAGFFVAGGTLPLHSGSYLERAADQNLERSLLEGRFCYVLNSRQMGKSSLCVRTMARLSERGIQCAFIDITKIGGRNVTPEQWYAGLAIEVGRSLDLRTPILDYWKAEQHLSPMQRFFGALRDVVLATLPGKVVVFVDEIDSTRSLPFSADEFFAGVRECFNRRVQDPEYGRLTFCFLGVAVPSDLIHDARTTPFNIGDRIYLKDFTFEEIQPLARELGPNGEAVMQRVFHWTNGHPFLTQSVCRALTMQGRAIDIKDVDALIQRDLLEPKVRETNINLSDVGNRVLNGYADGDDVDQYRADILSAYDKALAGKGDLPDDESNRITAVLKLSGLMRSEAGQLKVRNRIYEKAFDRAWVRENMPGQELRRQRIAYYAGVARTTLVAGAVIAVIGYLAINNLRMARAAEATAREMSWRAYVSDMNRLPILIEQNNVPAVQKLLDAHRDEPWRGAEWDYWNGAIHTALWETTKEFGKLSSTSPSGHLPQVLASSQYGGLVFIDRGTGRVARLLDLPKGPRYLQLRGGRKLLAVSPEGGGQLLDAETGKILRSVAKDIFLRGYATATDGQGRFAIAERGMDQGILDLSTMKFAIAWPIGPNFFAEVSADGRYAMCLNNESPTDLVTIYDLTTRKPIIAFDILGRSRAATFSADNATLTVGYFDGMLRRFDLASGKLLWGLNLTDDTITVINQSADTQVVAVGTRRRRSYQVRIEGGKPRVVRSYLDSAYPFVSSDGKFIYTHYWTMRAYPADAGEPVKTLKPEGNWSATLASEPDRLVLTTFNRVMVYPLTDGVLGEPSVQHFPKGYETWSTPQITPMVLISNGKNLILADAGQGMRQVFKVAGLPVNDAATQLDENRVLHSRDRLTYAVHDLSSGKQTADVLKFDAVTRLHLSSKGDRIVARSDSGALAVFDASTLKKLWSNTSAHEQAILAALFSRDGKLVVSAAHDDTAAIWDAESGRLISRLVGHAQSVIGINLTPDGKRAITVSDDQTMRMWDVQTGAELTTLGNVGDFPQFCCITSDGQFVVTGDSLGKVKIWPLYAPKTSAPKTP